MAEIAYVAGPMRGYAEYNFPAFADACARLRAVGHIVISPHEHDLENGFDPARSLAEQGFDLRAALRWDLDSVLSADRVVVLPGWEHSSGAQAEVAVAKAAGIPWATLADEVEK